MTVIYFLYLFAFIEMLPPNDLGWVVPKWQGMDGAHRVPPCPRTGLTGGAAGAHPQHRNPPAALQDPQEGGEVAAGNQKRSVSTCKKGEPKE